MTRHNAANAVSRAALVTPLGSTFTSAIPANDGNRAAGIAEVTQRRSQRDAAFGGSPPAIDVCA
ncbi:hypothetical protein GCM10010178_29370 [Lentzea flava]|uniref:Uncharacterized protein n=1 Tax=Lentzea flava TaxID=103732 RepID=A0ABQ2UHC4_9PSEU|nr:hypothetical protein GCM10010178_29370 [Lentzea flava]